MNRFRVTTVGIFCLLASVTGSVRSETLSAHGDSPSFKEASHVPDFQRHVTPLLGRLGCNGRSCHGSFQGQGGFRLSLFGFDFRMDLKGLTAANRINRKTPSDSLILQKPTLQIDHEGGQRFEVDSWEYALLQRWIKAGAQGIEKPSELLRLEVTPDEVVFHAESSAVPLKVVAIWENGDREDVTELSRFRTNDDSIVTVDENGLMTSQGIGDTHVVVFYDNGITAVPVLRPRDNSSQLTSHQDLPPGIDRFVNEKLDKLGIVPSALCTDSEFLRRVSIDLTGTLPTPEEVTSFLADQRPDKRDHKISELLERPAYAAWWANKLCDFSGCNPQQQAELGQETSVQWYMWTYKRLLENTPYDKLVKRIVLAQGRSPDQTYEDYAREMSSYFRQQDPGDFADREFMPHYWTRRSMQKPEEAAQAFAHNFLGIRLQCAQCHKHPFAPWTQDDFQEFSKFFEPIEFGVQSSDEYRYRELAKSVGLNVNNKDGSPIRDDVLRHARNGRTIPWRELYIADRDSELSLDLLRSGSVDLPPNRDPRLPIMDWMLEPENPFFATAFVNRVWAGYFHVGIIDPPDDLNPANPPSHPKLLAWLTRGFIDSGYDMKWLHRTIVSSQAYQRSWQPNDTNEEDRRNFSRSIPRRLPAEIVYDSVKQVLAPTNQQQEVRTDLSRRAIGHLSMRLAGTYAMQVFGKPERAVNCDCERMNQSTLLQSIFLQNDPLIDQRLEGSGWLEEIALRENTPTAFDHAELIREAWLRSVGHLPTADEETRALQHLKSADSITDGMRDLLWALLNTKEFILNKQPDHPRFPMTLSRRSFLKVGALGTSLTLSQYLELQAATGNADLGRSAILVFLMGGPAHQDTFDLKPNAPAEYRGQFRPTKTSVPGMEICEHLPRLASRANRYALIRGISHSLADHGLGTRYVMTGNLPTPVVDYPLFGSVVSKEFPSHPDIPSFVSIDRPVEGPGFLGAEFGPLSTGEKPQHGHPFRVRGITLDGSLTLDKFNKRKNLLEDIDTAFAGYEQLDDSVRGLNRFSEQAYRIIASKRSRDAFDLSLEPDREVDRFGRHDYGQSMMLATRLVEAGVRFVTVLLEGWDTHQDNFTQLGRELLPKFDQSLSAMFDRLGETGRLDSTSILVTGEFGRTPKVNNNAGRDHWARAMCSLMAGGDVRPGQVIGETDDKAQGPLHDRFSPDDLAATFFQNIGIDPKTEYQANVGRPITLIRDGSAISSVFAQSAQVCRAVHTTNQVAAFHYLFDRTLPPSSATLFLSFTADKDSQPGRPAAYAHAMPLFRALARLIFSWNDRSRDRISAISG